MGDLESEIKEIDSLNSFLSAYTSTPSNPPYPSFKSHGYYYNPFPIFGIEDEKSKKLKNVTPDFLLWNPMKNLALIIEIKGGNSVEQDDLDDQLKKYKEIPIQQIEERVKNISDNRTIEINQFYVGIVYYEETIQSCKLSAECSSRLDEMMREFMVLSQSPGDYLKCLNHSFIDFDDRLKVSLGDGIRIPKDNRRILYITENPSIEGTMWAIVNLIHDEFFNDVHTNKIQTDSIDLQDAFIYSNVKPKRIKKALNYLFQIGICEVEKNKYIFKLDEMGNPEEIKTKILNLSDYPLHERLF